MRLDDFSKVFTIMDDDSMNKMFPDKNSLVEVKAWAYRGVKSNDSYTIWPVIDGQIMYWGYINNDFNKLLDFLKLFDNSYSFWIDKTKLWPMLVKVDASNGLRYFALAPREEKITEAGRE